MNGSDQIDALEQRVADLKSSFGQARKETNEQVKARLDRAKADIAARQTAVTEKAGQASGRAQSQWKSMQADAQAKMQDLQDRIARKRDQHDVKMAEEDMPRLRRKTPPMPWITPPGPSTRHNWLSLTP